MQANFPLPSSFPDAYKEKFASCQTEDAFYESVTQNYNSLNKFFNKCEKHPIASDWISKHASLMSRIIHSVHLKLAGIGKELKEEREYSADDFKKTLTLVIKAHSISLKVLAVVPDNSLKELLPFSQFWFDQIASTPAQPSPPSQSNPEIIFWVIEEQPKSGR